MKTETVILLILLLVIVCAFIGYILLHKKDKTTDALHSKLNAQQNQIDLLKEKEQEKHPAQDPEPVYVPVIYGGYGRYGDWRHRPYWPRRRRW